MVKKTITGGKSRAHKQLIFIKEALPQQVINAVKKMSHVNDQKLKRTMLRQLKILFSVDVDSINGNR